MSILEQICILYFKTMHMSKIRQVWKRQHMLSLSVCAHTNTTQTQLDCMHVRRFALLFLCVWHSVWTIIYHMHAQTTINSGLVF